MELLAVIGQCLDSFSPFRTQLPKLIVTLNIDSACAASNTNDLPSSKVPYALSCKTFTFAPP